MGMPWFRVNTGWEEHPKVQALADDVKRDGALYAIRLWEWTAKFYPNGKITADTRTLERAMKWKGLGGALVESMARHRLLDGESGRFEPHDWTEHNGAAFNKWEADRNKRKTPKSAAAAPSQPDANPTETRTGSARKPPPTNSTNSTNSTKEKEQTHTEHDRRARVFEEPDHEKQEPKPDHESMFDPDPETDIKPVCSTHPNFAGPPPCPFCALDAKGGVARAPQSTNGGQTTEGGTQALVSRPEAKAALPYPAGGWPGCPPTAISRSELVQTAYETLKREFDPAGLWKPWDNWHQMEPITAALRAHPLATQPNPWACLMNEVIPGYRGDILTVEGKGPTLDALMREKNIARAISAARARAKGIDPNAKPASAQKPPPRRPEEWRETDTDFVPSKCPDHLRPSRRKWGGETTTTEPAAAPALTTVPQVR